MNRINLRGVARLGLVLAAGFAASLSWGQGHVICRLAVGADPAQLAADYGMTLLDTTSPSPFVLYDAPDGMTSEQAEHLIRTDPRVVWAEDDGEADSPENTGAGGGSTVAAVADRTALYARNNNFLRQIRYASSRNIDRSMMRVAVLDNGLSPLQPRLWMNVIASANYVGDGNLPHDLPWNVDSNGNGTSDEMLGHGTMVTGLIDLLAPQAKLIIVRVADSDGMATGWSLIKGLCFAVQNGARLANISLGSLLEIAALSDVLEWAESFNLQVVAPIGNNGIQDSLYPAAYERVLCVSGLLPDDHKAPFSNWDETADVAAPATGILSTWWDGTMGIWSGTSFAAPIITGALANAAPVRSPKTPRQLRTVLRSCTDNINTSNAAYQNRLGGRINVRNLVRLMMR